MLFLNRNVKYKILIIMFTMLIILLCYNTSAAPKEPAFVSTTYNGFKSIQKYILKISTPAAAVAIGSGILMHKFSFGDEEKIRTSKKLIKGTLFAYALILSTDLILSFIKVLIK